MIEKYLFALCRADFVFEPVFIDVPLIPIEAGTLAQYLPVHLIDAIMCIFMP